MADKTDAPAGQASKTPKPQRKRVARADSARDSAVAKTRPAATADEIRKTKTASKPKSTAKQKRSDGAAAPALAPTKQKPVASPKQATKKSPLPAATGAMALDPMKLIKAYADLAGKMLNRMIPEEKCTPAQLIQQIDKGPKGPQVIAAFDFDGTLIGGYSGNMLFQERRKRKEVSKQEMNDSTMVMFKTMVKLVEANEMVAQAFAKWAGKSEAEMAELSTHVYQNVIQDSVFPEMRRILEAHRRAGHTVVVATSASRYQAEPAVSALGIEHLLCTELEVSGGKLTGKLTGEALFGAGKAAAIERFVEQRGGSLAKTYFYADGSEEVGLMQSVGYPRPVNPGSKLLEAAKNNKWPVLRLTSRGSAKPADFVRNIAGMASLVPMLQTGLLVGAVTRDKRSLANTVMPAWIDTQMRINGVKMRISGGSNLRARRPAVFIFNHRNNFDGMIAAALVKTDYVALAKKEMGDNPIGKLIQKLMPTVLLDRTGSGRADVAKTLQPVVDAMTKEGYSVMLSPEGTRTKGHLNSVGPFKKGAFHMAIAAKVPIVPIVIRNALDMASHSGRAMRPCTIDVAILPPISVDDWNPRSISAKVEEVRKLFIETLNDFPAPDARE